MVNEGSGKYRAAFIQDPSLRTQPISSEESSKCQQIIDRMHQYVTTRRMEIRQQFEDYDKFPHRNYITRAQFRQRIGRLGLSTDETDLDEMNYRAFCSDIGGYYDYNEQEIEWGV